jgi:hypothetical protein
VNPCECGCGQVIDPAVDPCPFFKGQACQQLWLATPPNVKRPDLWRANQRQMTVWVLGAAGWTFRQVHYFIPHTHGLTLRGRMKIPLRWSRAKWKAAWEDLWPDDTACEHLSYELPRKAWAEELRQITDYLQERSDRHVAYIRELAQMSDRVLMAQLNTLCAETAQDV